MNVPGGQPSRQSPRILCIGIPVRDLIYRVEEVPARGSKVSASSFSEITGGNALNAAITISRLGGRVTLCGPLGREEANAAIYNAMAAENVDTGGLIEMNGVITPMSNVMIDPSGERTIVTYRDPKLWSVKLPAPNLLLDGVDAILTENRCAEFATDVCAEATRRGIPVVVDADRVMSQREGLLNASSHIIFSEEALHATAGQKDDVGALRKMASLTQAFLGVTSGARGVTWLGEGGRPLHMPAFPVHTVDTLGAGDAFHGAFTLAIAEGQAIEQAMRFASATAALKCTRFGGAFASPQRVEVDTFLSPAPTAFTS